MKILNFNFEPLPYERKYLRIGKRKLHKSVTISDFEKMFNDYVGENKMPILWETFDSFREYMYYIKRSVFFYNKDTGLIHIYKYK